MPPQAPPQHMCGGTCRLPGHVARTWLSVCPAAFAAGEWQVGEGRDGGISSGGSGYPGGIFYWTQLLGTCPAAGGARGGSAPKQLITGHASGPPAGVEARVLSLLDN